MRAGIKAVRVKAIGAALLVFCCLLLAASSARAVAFSDAYAGRETAVGLPVEVSGSNLGATTESVDPEEAPFSPGPSFHPAGHSVWVEWEAVATEYVTVSLCGSAIPAVLGVYRPADWGLYQLIQVDPGQVYTGGGCTPMSSGRTFKAEAGATYELFVDGDGDQFQTGPTEGPLSLRIEATPRPLNDDFANAEELTGRSESAYPGQSTYQAASSYGYNWAATQEPGEPSHGPNTAGASVWYRWTAPSTGSVELHLSERYSLRFALYRGESLGALEQIASGPEYAILPVQGGTTYRFAVDSVVNELGAGMANFALSLSMYKTAPPPSAAVSARPDRQPPRTSILGRKVRSRRGSATIRFSSNEAGGSFRCRLDRRRATRCSSPRTFSGLTAGPHRVKVRAVDAAGNADDSPAVVRFAIAGAPGRAAR